MSISATKVLANRFRIHTRFRRAERLRKLAMERPFLDGAHTRLLLVSQSHRIPQSQIFPFHHYAKDLKRLYGAQVREIDISSVLSGEPAKAMGANVVAFQTPFDIEDEKLWRLLDRLTFPDICQMGISFQPLRQVIRSSLSQPAIARLLDR